MSTGSALSVSFYWRVSCLTYSGQTVVFLPNVWYFSHHDTSAVETIHPCVFLLHIQKHTHVRHTLKDSENISVLRFRVNIFSKCNFMIFIPHCSWRSIIIFIIIIIIIITIILCSTVCSVLRIVSFDYQPSYSSSTIFLPLRSAL
jgi:hypothetical protein